ncbi:flavin reductase family protein [Limoniibacter endophyticus]|uniref:Flavin reductase n=1 Tax=Limoniibacter endophyticus TaxID=1565040 RepID=A0A8J3DED0_9HYPH|nr:flavin reductase family protein [Limoniibacter endophyticus]GHC60180.1 flavin reductase [Limoniibacter endophyticus]
MFYEPKNGHGLPHDPFKALVGPRPVGWISSIAKDGTYNLAPYSFFNAIGGNPPLVMFSSGGLKHSAANIRETGEFVCNIVSRPLAEKMNATSIDAPENISEFDHAGLTPAQCQIVKPPRVAQAPAALECMVTEIIEPRDITREKTGDIVVIGQVVGVHIDESVLKDGLVDAVALAQVSRLGYMDFSFVESVFQLYRPRWKD